MVTVPGFQGPCSEAREVNTHHLCPEGMVSKAPKAGRCAGGDRPTHQMARVPSPMKLAPCCPLPRLLNSHGPLAWNPHTRTGPSRAGLSCPCAAIGRLRCRTGRRDPAALKRIQRVSLGPRPAALLPSPPRGRPCDPSTHAHTHTHTHTHTLRSSSPATCLFHPGTGEVTKGTCPGPAWAFALSHPGMQFDKPTLLL